MSGAAVRTAMGLPWTVVSHEHLSAVLMQETARYEAAENRFAELRVETPQTSRLFTRQGQPGAFLVLSADDRDPLIDGAIPT